MDSVLSEAPDSTVFASELAPLFSADSHVIEDVSLWEGIVPTPFFGDLSLSEIHARPGRVDPVARIEEMAIDGVSGEVLYPSLGLKLFGLEDAPMQERAFQRYNDWLIEFCSTAPDLLIGIGLLSCYDIDHAVAEIERCAQAGLRGAEVWQMAHPDLPFSGDHYDPLWAAASDLKMPISLHILTGYKSGLAGQGLSMAPSKTAQDAIGPFRVAINLKLLGVCDALLEILFSGTFERFPALKLVLVENEIGWLPFILDQFDYYIDRWWQKRPTNMLRPPSQYFGQQLFATFFRDPVGMRMLEWWGSDGCMWSSDYPHGNSTWPNSQQVVKDNLGYLPPEKFNRIVRGTARALYGLD